MSEKKKRKPRKSIKDKKNLDISIDTDKIDVDIERKDGKFTANVDTKNLDVTIQKTDDETKVEVTATKKIWRWIGKIVSRILIRKK